MKLILSSCDFRNKHSKGVIIEHLDKPIAACNLLFIPNEKATHKRIHSDFYYRRLEGFGFSRKLISVFDYYHAEDYCNLTIDVLYISGGNTFATLNRLRNCHFDKEIIRYVKQGVVYIGGSAGAHIASLNIFHVAKFDSIPEGMTNYNGLGLFNGILICHYSEDRKDVLDCLMKTNTNKVFALTDDDTLLVLGDKKDERITLFHYNNCSS